MEVALPADASTSRTLFLFFIIFFLELILSFLFLDVINTKGFEILDQEMNHLYSVLRLV